NRAVPASYTAQFEASSSAAAKVLAAHSNGATVTPVAARAEVTRYIAEKKLSPTTAPALSSLVADMNTQVQAYGSLATVPAAAVSNVRNDMYLASEGLKRFGKEASIQLAKPESKVISDYRGALDKGTRFIPTWVK